MKSILRLIIFLSLLGIITSAVLLLNFTAPNPTGRRYSSEMPVTDVASGSNAIGKSGEDVLSKDLNLPSNNLAGQIQCVCGNNSQTKSKRCNACLTILPSLLTSTPTYRIPDFVGSGFLAESKNEQGLLYSGREVTQINEYVLAAILMRAKLWVYVRVNTEVAPEFVNLVESTGGGIIPYFTLKDYVDPVDAAAQKGVVASSGVLGLTIIGLLASRRFKNRPILVSSPTPKPPRAPKPLGDPVSKAVRKTDNAEDFMQRTKEKKRQDIDLEDSRDDLL